MTEILDSPACPRDRLTTNGPTRHDPSPLASPTHHLAEQSRIGDLGGRGPSDQIGLRQRVDDMSANRCLALSARCATARASCSPAIETSNASASTSGSRPKVIEQAHVVLKALTQHPRPVDVPVGQLSDERRPPKRPKRCPLRGGMALSPR